MLGWPRRLWLLLVACAGAGFCGGAIGVVQAFAADIAGPGWPDTGHAAPAEGLRRSAPPHT